LIQVTSPTGLSPVHLWTSLSPRYITVLVQPTDVFPARRDTRLCTRVRQLGAGCWTSCIKDLRNVPYGSRLCRLGAGAWTARRPRRLRQTVVATQMRRRAAKPLVQSSRPQRPRVHAEVPHHHHSSGRSRHRHGQTEGQRRYRRQTHRRVHLLKDRCQPHTNNRTHAKADVRRVGFFVINVSTVIISRLTAFLLTETGDCNIKVPDST